MLAALFFILVAVVLIMASLIVLLRPVKTGKLTPPDEESNQHDTDDQR